MYLVERSLHTLKYVVRIKACSEGSIAEAYLMNESETFCSRYLSGIETWFTRDERNDDRIPNDEVIGELEVLKKQVYSFTPPPRSPALDPKGGWCQLKLCTFEKFSADS